MNRTEPRTDRFVEGVPSGYVVDFRGDPEDAIEYRRPRIDWAVDHYREQGFCAAVSPTFRLCTKRSEHADAQHWAESPKYTIVEAWTGGDDA